MVWCFGKLCNELTPKPSCCNEGTIPTETGCKPGCGPGLESCGETDNQLGTCCFDDEQCVVPSHGNPYCNNGETCKNCDNECFIDSLRGTAECCEADEIATPDGCEEIEEPEEEGPCDEDVDCTIITGLTRCCLNNACTLGCYRPNIDIS